MPAYSVEITIHKCQRCSRTATHEVFNKFNALIGRFCKKHANEQVAASNDADTSHNRAVRLREEEGQKFAGKVKIVPEGEGDPELGS